MKLKGMYKHNKREREEKNLNTKQVRKSHLVSLGSPIPATINEKVSSFSHFKLYQNYCNIKDTALHLVIRLQKTSFWLIKWNLISIKEKIRRLAKKERETKAQRGKRSEVFGILNNGWD